jgi:hypothetical protein
LRERLTAADARHAGEDARHEDLARQRESVDDRSAEGQLEIDEETRRSERERDAEDVSAVRGELDWLQDAYLREGRRDRADAADDRARSRADRAAARQDRNAADADRQQSAVDDAQHR